MGAKSVTTEREHYFVCAKLLVVLEISYWLSKNREITPWTTTLLLLLSYDVERGVRLRLPHKGVAGKELPSHVACRHPIHSYWYCTARVTVTELVFPVLRTGQNRSDIFVGLELHIRLLLLDTIRYCNI